MTTGYGNILERGSRIKKLLLASAAALTLSAALSAPSWAAVKEGRGIENDHGIEYVALDGYPARTAVLVEVVRNDVVIGSKTRTTDAAGFLEINHLGGADCWNAPVTPDIIPGDTIRTTVLDGNGAPTNDVDTSTVRDVTIETDRTQVVGNTIEMYGQVRSLDAAPIDKAGDVLELRMRASFDWDTANDNDLIESVAAADYAADGDGNPDTFKHVFNLSTAADAQRAADDLANGAMEQAIEWVGGAAEVEPAPELTVFSGTDLEAGDCPPRVGYAVTSSNPSVINAANVGQDLVVSGSSFDASAVRVEVSDGTNTLTQNATPVPANGGQSWTATFPGGANELADGNLTARAFYTLATGEIGGAELQIRKDTAPPQVSDVNLADASDSGESNTDDLTRDNTPTLNGTAEPNSSVRIFDGATLLGQVTADATGSWEIVVPNDRALADGAHSIRARATDGAGNSAESANALALNVDTRVAVVNASPQGGVYASARSVTLSLVNAAQESGTKIYFTLDGSTPQPIEQQLYSGPIAVSQNAVLKYRALDRAGNLSSTGSQTYRFDAVAPRLTSKSPAANATGVGRGANVRVSFSENVTGVSGSTFKLKLGARTVPAVVTYNAATKTAVLNPKASLAAGKKYTVVLTSGIRDGVGNRLSATSWRFTTR